MLHYGAIETILPKEEIASTEWFHLRNVKRLLDIFLDPKKGTLFIENGPLQQTIIVEK